MKIVIFALLLALGLGLKAQHTNILISDVPSPEIPYDSPEEPSIAINPANPDHMIAGANLNHIYVTFNGGVTWSQSFLSSASHGVWGDPCLAFDNFGHVYYLHLANPPAGMGEWIDRIVCQRSDDGGLTWNDGSAIGINGIKAQDKQWVTIDPSSGTLYVTWTQFDNYGSSSTLDSSAIMFSKSTDFGVTWSTALRISHFAGNCIDDDDTPEGAMPALGASGDIFVTWSFNNKLWMNKSSDGGITWLPQETLIGTQPGGWAYDIPGLSRCNGLPVLYSDMGNSSWHGNLYLNWSDQRNGTTDTDVWFKRSTDNGLTWSPDLRVNNDAPGKHQFMSWMAVDQITGFIWIVYYDRRDYTLNYTDVYLAVSRDGGLNFTEFKISETAFNPYPSVFFGDYTNISAHNNIIRPIWARQHMGELSIYTAMVDTIVSAPAINLIPFAEMDPGYPNPFDEQAYFTVKLHQSGKLNIDVLDYRGIVVQTIVKEETYPAGKYIFHFQPNNSSIASGVYMVRMRTEDKVICRKIVYKK
ncbi:MAG: glycosyl hydrolase [Bacteroidetes bacterium HGW-Bacteroidetes-21]|jgi:hypothetical protein|nr:MAG: glycosyl hydrolase [Bacteroidetes bacterium HGW-Bacteroidetes-21]